MSLLWRGGGRPPYANVGGHWGRKRKGEDWGTAQRLATDNLASGVTCN